MINPIVIKEGFNGVQKVYRFDNGYGLSVIRHDYSYGSKEGLWEIAPLKFNSEDNDNWEFCGMRLGIIQEDDVQGHLTEDDVESWIETMKAFSPISLPQINKN